MFPVKALFTFAGISFGFGLLVYGEFIRILIFKEPVANHALSGHVIRTEEVFDEGSCRLKCYLEPNCVSINVGSEENGKYTCELNNATDESLSHSALEARQGYIHHAVENFCHGSPCSEANDLCQVGFGDSNFRCVSHDGHTPVSAVPYVRIGCFKDTSSRAIPTLEGKDSILDGSYRMRENPIEKCYEAAKARGFLVFAVQHGGWCASSLLAAQTFDKYGNSSDCKSDSKGGPWANQVYLIKMYGTVGCYNDASNPAIQTLEGTDPILDGEYSSRRYPIAKCALAAMRKGYRMFALQDGGSCASSVTAQQTYDKYGKANTCMADGEGGPSANQVYQLY